MAAGNTLRVEVLTPAIIHWSNDEWRTVHDAYTRDTGLGLHFVDLPTDSLPSGSAVFLTFYWLKAEKWEGKDFSVNIHRGNI